MTQSRQRLFASTLLSAAAILTCGGLVAAVLTPSVAQAQDLTTGTLEGRLTNASGAPISGATVTVTSNSRGFTQTLKTDANGVFA